MSRLKKLYNNNSKISKEHFKHDLCIKVKGNYFKENEVRFKLGKYSNLHIDLIQFLFFINPRISNSFSNKLLTQIKKRR